VGPVAPVGGRWRRWNVQCNRKETEVQKQPKLLSTLLKSVKILENSHIN
jgi:hypothetical protein